MFNVTVTRPVQHRATAAPCRSNPLNHLYYGDNLKVLRDSIKDASVDLVYLDPPFNSNAGYNILFKAPDGAQSHAQIEAFDDTWHWNESAEEAFGDVMRGQNANVTTMLRAMRIIGRTSITFSAL